ncbi:MAG: hypothetical protein AUG80_16455 [Candidatus Rokubacteria bacterium 13_1_20CM_4_68_9]|nr:MAG: hypothetical protein AUG80_16455 [Candidatus Rokubacteria bacterium 13_1_20CM_4_68_9]
MRARLVEAEDVELEDALPDRHDLPDLVREHVAVLELATVADRRGDLAGEDDRAGAQVLLEPRARQPDLEPRERERHDHEDEQGQEHQLGAHAQPHHAFDVSRKVVAGQRLAHEANRPTTRPFRHIDDAHRAGREHRDRRFRAISTSRRLARALRRLLAPRDVAGRST